MELLQIGAAAIALVAFVFLARWLLMPKRYHAKRPRMFWSGVGCLALSALMYAAANGM
jgi:hypothetical protein